MNSESKAAANGVGLLIIDNKIIQFSHIFKYVTYAQLSKISFLPRERLQAIYADVKCITPDEKKFIAMGLQVEVSQLDELIARQIIEEEQPIQK